MPRIAIIGAGAIGGAMAALLNRAGHDVTLIVRPDQLPAFANGLRIDGVLGSWQSPVPVATTIDERPDLVLLAVKTQDVVEALRPHVEGIGDAPLVTMQNGIRSDELAAELLPAAQIISAVVLLVATSLEPAVVTIASQGSLVIGRPLAPEQEIDSVQRTLGAAVPTTISSNILGAHWLKLLINLNNAVPALVNQPLQTAYRDPFLSRMMVLLMREGLRAVDRTSIRLESLPGVSVRLIRLMAMLPVGLAGSLVLRQLRQASPLAIYGSTLQSIQRGRPTEIAFLNGEIVRLGQEHGWVTPLNSEVVELVKEVERSGRYFTSDELHDRLGGLIS